MPSGQIWVVPSWDWPSFGYVTWLLYVDVMGWRGSTWVSRVVVVGVVVIVVVEIVELVIEVIVLVVVEVKLVAVVVVVVIFLVVF